MTTLALTDLAAIAEIVGVILVVVSLWFVVYSIRKNTEAVQASNDNFMYDLQYARTRVIVANADVAEIYMKIRNGEELSELQKERLRWDKLQEMSCWEMAFNRHRDGMYSNELWHGWDLYYRNTLIDQFPQEWWDDSRKFYDQPFQDHVDAAYRASVDAAH